MLMTMDELLVIVCLAVLGLIIGSFAGASVWRLRLRQLQEDLKTGEPVDPTELKRLTPLAAAKTTEDRSRCLNCGHVLHWYDLVPLLSWLSLGGKCRYCKTFIGWYEPSVELATALLFVVSFLAWPFGLQSIVDFVQFGLWLVASGLLVVLFIYDLKWFLLPDKIMFPFIAVAGIFALLRVAQASDLQAAIISLAGGIVILSGIYYVLHAVSKGQWIGFGDVKLGLGLALLLGDWALAFIALFLANVIGLIAVLPGMLRGTVQQETRIPFGPFMILGALIAFFLGTIVLTWYTNLNFVFFL